MNKTGRFSAYAHRMTARSKSDFEQHVRECVTCSTYATNGFSLHCSIASHLCVIADRWESIAKSCDEETKGTGK